MIATLEEIESLIGALPEDQLIRIEHCISVRKQSLHPKHCCYPEGKELETLRLAASQMGDRRIEDVSAARVLQQLLDTASR